MATKTINLLIGPITPTSVAITSMTDSTNATPAGVTLPASLTRQGSTSNWQYTFTDTTPPYAFTYTSTFADGSTTTDAVTGYTAGMTFTMSNTEAPPTDTGPVPPPAAGVFQAGSDEQQPEFTAVVLSGSPFSLLSRAVNNDGQLITPANVAAISATVTDMVTDTSVTSAFTPQTVVSSSLLTDSRWTTDPTGYNLSLRFPGSAVPTAGHSYKVDVTITPTNGDPFRLTWNLQAAA